MVSVMQSIINRREYFVLTAMLASLHAALWVDFGSPISRTLILVHFGFFLIWQPVQGSNQKYTWYNSIIFIVLILMFAYWVNWWLVFIWLIILIGIAGGRVVTHQVDRYVLFLVMIFLISELLIKCIPNLFALGGSDPVFEPVKYIITLIPFALPFFPVSYSRNTGLSVDLLHAITSSLLVSLLALSSLVIMYRTGTNYFTALIQSLLGIGLSLIIIGWLLSANTGSGGLPQIWSRSLLNIGTPFEQWLTELALLKEEHQSPRGFLESAIDRLVNLPWMSGAKWQISDYLYINGNKTNHSIDVNIDTHNITLYTRVPVSGALRLHCNLLIKLIEYFYQAKVNEHELAKQAHMQAIFETGARITHDIKNLLQSMHSMVTILQADTSDQESRSVIILKRQFPYFIQRLEQAMNKLQTPQEFDPDTTYLKDWWGDLYTHYKDYNIEFSAEIDNNPAIPFDLFHSVAENLLENAITKRKDEPGIRIMAKIQVINKMISMQVSDTGSAIDEKTATVLFRESIKSDNGLGIGLMQAARQAKSMGYTLALKYNFNGNVCFELHN
jgi:signal transduction histidine kinase